MKWIKDIYNKLLVSSSSEDEISAEVIEESPNLTRQELLNSIKKHFDKRMREETTDEGLLFATSFYIYLNEDDYREREQSFAYTVKEAVNKFNREITKKLSRYPDYRSHAQYWQFQFIPFTADNLVEGMRDTIDKIPPKQVFIMSFIHPSQEGGVHAAGGNERVVATVHTKDSLTMSNLAFDRNALRGINILAKDRFNVDFNDFHMLEKDPLSDEQAQSSGVNARATIKVSGAKFLLGLDRHSSIWMVSDNLQISGRGGMSDTSGGIDVVRIDSDKVMDRQVLLHYNSNTQKLYMTAQGDVMLNEVAVVPGTEQEVYNKSRILINGDIQLEVFDIKK